MSDRLPSSSSRLVKPSGSRLAQPSSRLVQPSTSVTKTSSAKFTRGESGTTVSAQSKTTASSVKPTAGSSRASGSKASGPPVSSSGTRIRMAGSSSRAPTSNTQTTKMKITGVGLKPTAASGKKKCSSACPQSQGIEPFTEEVERGRPVPPGRYYVPLVGAADKHLGSEEKKLRQKLQKYTPTALSHWKVEPNDPFARDVNRLRKEHPDIISGMFQAQQGRYIPEESTPLLEERLDPNLREEEWSISLREAMSLESGVYEQQSPEDGQMESYTIDDATIERQLEAQLPTPRRADTPLFNPTRAAATLESQPRPVSGISDIRYPQTDHVVEKRMVAPSRMQSPVGEIDTQHAIYMQRQLQTTPLGTTVDTRLTGTKLLAPGQAQQIEIAKHDLLPAPPPLGTGLSRSPFQSIPTTGSMPTFAPAPSPPSPNYSMRAQRGSPPPTMRAPSPPAMRASPPGSPHYSMIAQHGSPIPAASTQPSALDNYSMIAQRGSPDRPMRIPQQPSPAYSTVAQRGSPVPGTGTTYAQPISPEYSRIASRGSPVPSGSLSSQTQAQSRVLMSSIITSSPDSPVRMEPSPLSFPASAPSPIRVPRSQGMSPPSETPLYRESSPVSCPPCAQSPYRVPTSPTMSPAPESPIYIESSPQTSPQRTQSPYRVPMSPARTPSPGSSPQRVQSPYRVPMSPAMTPSPGSPIYIESSPETSPQRVQSPYRVPMSPAMTPSPGSPIRMRPSPLASPPRSQTPTRAPVSPAMSSSPRSPIYTGSPPGPSTPLAQSPISMSVSPTKTLSPVSPIRLEPAVEVPASSKDTSLDVVRILIDEERQDVTVSQELSPTLADKLSKLKKKPQSIRLLEETLDQSIPGEDENEAMKSDVVAELMYSQESGTIDPSSSPKKTYEQLFPLLQDEPSIPVSPAPAPLHDIVVPVGEADMDALGIVNDELSEVVAIHNEEIPSANVYAETVAKDDQESKSPSLQREHRPKEDKKISDGDDAAYIPAGELEEQKAPWDINLGSLEDLVGGKMSMMSTGERLPSDESVRATAGRLEYVLDLQRPQHYSCVQLRGSQLPAWFPGYYSVLPHVDGCVRLERSPSTAFAAAWQVFSPYQAAERSEVVIL